jgi:hypothetical protein
MNTQLTAVRQLLGDDEAEKAIDLLASSLNTADLTHKDAYLDELTLISSAWNSYNKKIKIGTLAGTEATVEGARINERLLKLINDIEEGRDVEATEVVAPPKRRNWFLIGLGASLGALLLAGAVYWYMNRDTSPVCPNYPTEKKWKVAVLPFTNLGDRTAKPEQVVVSTINQITAKNNLSVDAKVWEARPDRIEKDKQKALSHCGADLLITGQYLVLKDDSVQVSLNYQFSDNRPPIQTDFYGFRNIAALSSGLFKESSITDAIFSLCMVIALREDNDTLTQKWMLKIDKPEDWVASMRTEHTQEMARVAAAQTVEHDDEAAMVPPKNMPAKNSKPIAKPKTGTKTDVIAKKARDTLKAKPAGTKLEVEKIQD